MIINIEMNTMKTGLCITILGGLLALSLACTPADETTSATTISESEIPLNTATLTPTDEYAEPGTLDYAALGMTELEIAQWEERGSATVDTAEKASILAGFQVYQPEFLPVGFVSGKFSVASSGGGLPESLQPKFDNTKVFQTFSSPEYPGVGLFITHLVHPTGLGGGTSTEICGYSGECSLTPADPDNASSQNPILSLAWGGETRFYLVSASLNEPLDEEMVMKIICSIRVE